MKTTSVFFAVLISAAALASSARADLVLNGGFEQPGSQVSVPTDWTANSAYTSTSFNITIDTPVNSGSWALRISNNENQNTPVLSQILSTVAGTTYKVDFFAMDQLGDNGSFLTVAAGGQHLTLVKDIGHSYQEYSFQFVGSGSDTLAISALNSSNFYFVDDVSVNAINSAVPEPSTWAMMILGFAGIGAMTYRRRRTAALAA